MLKLLKEILDEKDVLAKKSIWAFGGEYGGALLVGKVDRIDVDDEGNAVIVDYKGSVKASHQIAGKTIEAPGKVQALMYAQAIKRQLGLNVVGAFYVSYGSTPAIAGACDASEKAGLL